MSKSGRERVESSVAKKNSKGLDNFTKESRSRDKMKTVLMNSEFCSCSFVIRKDVSFVIPVENKENQFVIATGNEVSLIRWDGKSEKVSILETLFVDPNNTFNDGKCDPSGRLWTGTIAKGLLEGTGSPTGNLYSFQNKKISFAFE
ncbi:hypothetical protein NQ317_006467 [Molorchus minor]|uniref:SMP-30/Gluconolactonase/LRE-like region domain-containing protein n=1 Tax=Molorchus minor TaxID=1323400 RepID=A0ABQ9J5K3_9CUCU|nr:hypothetical protein NQ317_006467 [Molorchus minor]